MIAHAISLTCFVLSPLVTFLHEFGHAVAAWLLGCPAIPAFDFVYGGGITHHGEFRLPLAILMGCAWALRHDSASLDWYPEGKGGALMNDLEVIALDVHIWTGWPVDVERAAGWLLSLSFLPVAIAVGLYVFRDGVSAFARSLLLLERDP